jgi:SSS family solute:Na+ symporter
MQRVEDHYLELAVFLALVGVVIALGFWAARWRRPASMYSLDEWGLGGRSFGPVLTWFLVGGNLYTAHTLVALPALLFAVGAFGFYAVPYAVITPPLVFLALSRMWSVAHVHGLITPADFVKARFGPRWLALAVAVAGILATMPYLALQLVGMEVVFKVLGLNGTWPLWVAFGLLAVFTYNAGLRAPALIAIVKDVLILWVVLAAVVIVATRSGGLARVFDAASAKFEATSSPSDGLLLNPTSHIGFITLVVGSAFALLLYPHAMTSVLAARNRASVRFNLAALPIYTFMLGIVAILGYVAIAENVTPVGADPAQGLPGDRNTIMPKLFDDIFPDWVAGTAYAAIVIGAFVPAAIMSIGAANLFTRNIYKEFFRRNASAAEEMRVSRIVSLGVKFGALAVIVSLDPQYANFLQLVGGVIILQTLPSVGFGLFTSWLNRRALITGLVAGLIAGTAMLYQIPQLDPDGKVIREHFGGWAWPLANVVIGGGYSIYVGLGAVVVNIAVAVMATPVLRRLGVQDGHDITWRRDYVADEGEPRLRRLEELLDGRPLSEVPTETAAKHAVRPSHPRDEPAQPVNGSRPRLDGPVNRVPTAPLRQDLKR